MELIEIELSEFSRRSRSVVVTHSSTELSRGLEYGERVLILGSDGYRVAVVADIDFEMADTTYRLVLGARVSEETAQEYLVGELDQTVPSMRRVSVDDVADLLARSGAVHRIPLQRQVARRLLDR